MFMNGDRDSVVGMATGYRLDGLEFELRWGVKNVLFFISIQTSRGTYLAF
jgi:hypothetical protein